MGRSATSFAQKVAPVHVPLYLFAGIFECRLDVESRRRTPIPKLQPQSPQTHRSLHGHGNKFAILQNVRLKTIQILHFRFQFRKMQKVRSDHSVGRYVHLKHRRSYISTNYKPSNLSSYLRDGLNSLHLQKYKLLQQTQHKLYTLVNFHIQQPTQSKH